MQKFLKKSIINKSKYIATHQVALGLKTLSACFDDTFIDTITFNF